MSQVRWRVLAAVTAGLMCVSAALAGAADATSAAPAGGISGVKGDPQPEIKPFKIASTGYGGANAAVESNGAMVVAYVISNGDGKTVVCVLDRGASKCSSSVTLTPPGGEDLEGTPVVFAPSPNHVVVVTSVCCYANANNDTLVYTSANGGRTFAAPVGIGDTVEVSGVAALIGGQIVYASGGHDGAQVESVPVAASGPPAETATPIAAVSYDIGVGAYKGGALVASQYDGSSTDWTYVDYAPAGKNFNASGSYHSVAKFQNEELVGISGNALLTETVSGALKLRLFNGATFGAAHVVPALAKQLGGPAWWYLDQDPAGRTHVFSDRAFAPVSYDLYMQTTSAGASWSSPFNLGNAIESDYFGGALDSIGSGLVVGTTDHEPVWIYPVLAPQGVSFALQKSTIGLGRTTVGAGKGSPVAKGRTVWLQQERSGTWWTVATTHETSSGSFSFAIKGSAAGTRDFRAVVSDFAGYLQYGYSAARALKVSERASGR
jgi:hypothetical protein